MKQPNYITEQRLQDRLRTDLWCNFHDRIKGSAYAALRSNLWGGLGSHYVEPGGISERIINA